MSQAGTGEMEVIVVACSHTRPGRRAYRTPARNAVAITLAFALSGKEMVKAIGMIAVYVVAPSYP